MRYHASCVNCGEAIVVTEKAVFHARSGTVSCHPVECEYGFFSEPVDVWTGQRAAV